ncbi:hypothetical protein XENOCAPTIV_016218 [Xenoophorus captivus]|uniref:Uncharacterized protein n=1 Tax=Xenoophorus captivus TaxID=1517983 RepID=A0ABV0QIJ0_9TELE
MDLDPTVIIPAVLFTVVAVYLASSLLSRKPDRPSSSSAGTNKPKVGYGDEVPPSRGLEEPLFSLGPEPAEKNRGVPDLKVKALTPQVGLMHVSDEMQMKCLAAQSRGGVEAADNSSLRAAQLQIRLQSLGLAAERNKSEKHRGRNQSVWRFATTFLHGDVCLQRTELKCLHHKGRRRQRN